MLIDTYEWSEDTRTALCYLQCTNTHEVFIGMAIAHPDDEDMMSEKTGRNIAYRRAFIKYLQFCRNNITKPALDALKQLYYSINRSKHYNEKSYEARMLQRQIKLKQEEMDMYKELISIEKEELKELIDTKEEFYQRVRKNRNKDEIR